MDYSQFSIQKAQAEACAFVFWQYSFCGAALLLREHFGGKVAKGDPASLTPLLLWAALHGK